MVRVNGTSVSVEWLQLVILMTVPTHTKSPCLVVKDQEDNLKISERAEATEKGIRIPEWN